VDFKTSDVLLETPSATWQDVTSLPATTGGGPVVVRFDAQAYVNDFNSGPISTGRTTRRCSSGL
jgi:hypothetical protein